MPRCIAVLLLTTLTLSTYSAAVRADDGSIIQPLLEKPIIAADQSLKDVQAFVESRVPPLPKTETVGGWQEVADRLRADVLDRVVFRGEARAWRDARTKVEWLETIDGGPGYRIKKLRYEALPGLWIPALLYEPEKLDGKVPVSLHVNGHDPNGKAAPYKQIRSINLAKRGMIVLNPEWLGMGQLRGDGYRHGCMNQLDLCGTSGLAPFYLAMKRGLDVLIAHEHADPGRVAVSGLSGGGWQTIIISSLDTRVKLCNPVAGYSSFLTRTRHFKDLGDSEQTPCDLATLADYSHLTAMLAPRPTLLTYNAKDDCCFESGYALPPLVEAARPFFEKFDKPENLRTHVNHDPGTHNYEKENREAFYKMVGDHFFPRDEAFDATEIPSDGELKSKDELNVGLAEGNANFNSLARELAKALPDSFAQEGVKSAHSAVTWQDSRRVTLDTVISPTRGLRSVAATMKSSEEIDGLKIRSREFRISGSWTFPVVEFARGEPKETTIVIADAGRKSVAAEVERLLADGHRVLAADLFYFGESKIAQKDYLFALLVATVGERPLAIQAAQLAILARHARPPENAGPVRVVAIGPRSCLIALVAASMEEQLIGPATPAQRARNLAGLAGPAWAIGRLELQGCLGSLKEIIEQNWSVEKAPEVFCFGLLKEADLKQLIALVAPRPVVIREPSDRAKQEFAGLKAWYATLGVEFDPLDASN